MNHKTDEHIRKSAKSAEPTPADTLLFIQTSDLQRQQRISMKKHRCSPFHVNMQSFLTNGSDEGLTVHSLNNEALELEEEQRGSSRDV